MAKCAVSTLFCSKQRLKHSSNQIFFQEGHLHNEKNKFSLNNMNLENVIFIIITCILGCKISYAGSRSKEMILPFHWVFVSMKTKPGFSSAVRNRK